ncbi:hypothetical protein RFI_19792, partial [Reticulomyxa filosa]
WNDQTGDDNVGFEEEQTVMELRSRTTTQSVSEMVPHPSIFWKNKKETKSKHKGNTESKKMDTALVLDPILSATASNNNNNNTTTNKNNNGNNANTNTTTTTTNNNNNNNNTNTKVKKQHKQPKQAKQSKQKPKKHNRSSSDSTNNSLSSLSSGSPYTNEPIDEQQRDRAQNEGKVVNQKTNKPSQQQQLKRNESKDENEDESEVGEDIAPHILEMTQMAEQSFLRGEFDKSKEQWNNVLPYGETMPYLYAGYAILLCFGFKKYQEAETYLQKALELEPENIAFRRHLGNVYMEWRKFSQAVVQFKQIIDIYNDETIDKYEGILLRNRDEINYNYAYGLEQCDAFGEAVKFYRYAVGCREKGYLDSLHPKHHNGRAKLEDKSSVRDNDKNNKNNNNDNNTDNNQHQVNRLTVIIHDQAVSHRNEDDDDNEEEEDANELSTGNPRKHANTNSNVSMTKDTPTPTPTPTPTTTTDSRNDIFSRYFIALFCYARCLRKNKELDESETSWKKLLQMSPDHYGVHVEYGICLCDLRRYEEAQDHYLKAMTLWSWERCFELITCIGGTRKEFSLLLARYGWCIYHIQKNIPLARQCYECALSYDSNNTLAMKCLGILLHREFNDSEKALQYLGLVIKMEPNSAISLAWYADCLRCAKNLPVANRLEQVDACWNKALKIRPDLLLKTKPLKKAYDAFKTERRAYQIGGYVFFTNICHHVHYIHTYIIFFVLK